MKKNSLKFNVKRSKLPCKFFYIQFPPEVNSKSCVWCLECIVRPLWSLDKWLCISTLW